MPDFVPQKPTRGENPSKPDYTYRESTSPNANNRSPPDTTNDRKGTRESDVTYLGCKRPIVKRSEE